jgi:pilus assembly protein Flp/PilA
MFELNITPELLGMIVGVILALAFDWFPVLSPWFDTLSELKKRQLMGVLLFVTVLVIYGGLCIKLFSSATFACTQVSLAELIKAAFLIVMTNYTFHKFTKPSNETELDRQIEAAWKAEAKQRKAQGMVEYALILVLVAVVVIAALTILGPLVADIFSTINASL